MTLTQLIADRIEANVPGLASVGVAADIEAVLAESIKFDSVWVIPWSDRGGQNQLDTGGVEQRREPAVGVLMAVRNLRATKGAAALVDVETLRDLLDAELLGWSPEAKYDPMLFDTGKLYRFVKGGLIWLDIYKTAYLRRSA